MAGEQLDVAIVGQDPRFGGGFRTMATAFWNAATEIGRSPHLFFLSRGHALRLVPPGFSSLSPRRELFHEPFEATALPSTLPELDAVNQVVGGLRLARRVRAARTVFVVATTAPYGFGAVAARRPYALWLATGLESEWAARRRGLGRSRRIALELNRPVLRMLERLVIRRAQVVFALSPFARETVAEAGGVTLDRVRVLPAPIDTELLAPVADTVWEATLGAPVIVFTGRANDPRKNFALLAEAFELVRRELPDARLRVIGEPPRQPSGEGVELLGPMANRDIVEPLRTSSVFVFPSLQEGFGIAVAEAMAAGVPVVVTPCGGPEELVRASGGGVVLDGFGADELASTLLELLRDTARLRAMRTAGREYIARRHAPTAFEQAVARALEELAVR